MTTHEWIETFPILVGIGGMVWGWIQRQWKLPNVAVWALKELDKVGVNTTSIEGLMIAAKTVNELDNAGRQAWVRERLQTAAKSNGFELTDATANMIIEWVYGRLKAKR